MISPWAAALLPQGEPTASGRLSSDRIRSRRPYKGESAEMPSARANGIDLSASNLNLMQRV